MFISIATFIIVNLLPFSGPSNYSYAGLDREETLRSAVLGEKELSNDSIGGAISRAVKEVKNLKFPQLPVADDVPADEKSMIVEKKKDAQDFNFSSGNIIAVDTRSGEVLFERSPDREWSIASITKLMTALVFLDSSPDWEKVHTIVASDRRDGGIIYLFSGDEVKVKDLFYSSLIASDNVATVALVHSMGMSEQEFVSKMNEKAKEMNLMHTIFFDATGLNNNNVSTAREVAALAKEAFSRKEIRDATLKKEYSFLTLGGRQKKITSTDHLLDVFPNNGIKIMGGKTGYNNSAGYCFTGKFVDLKGNEIITVVLGDDTRDARFEQTYDLANWVYKSYNW